VRTTLALIMLYCILLPSPEIARAITADNSSIVQEISGSLSGGYHNYNRTGSRSKVGEYDVLDSGMESSFDFTGRSGGKFFNMSGQFLDENDQNYYMNLDINRYLRSNFSYTRFQHFLEHDRLTNQDYAQDFNKGEDNKLLIEELKANNTIFVPDLPFLKFNFDYRSYQKQGHRQATTIGKCSQCHVTSRNKYVNTSTNDVTTGVEATLGPATFSYSHLLRDFTEHASAPMANYGNGASFFLVKGAAPYSQVPDSRLTVDTLSIRSALPWDSTMYANVQHGKRENQTTGNDVTFNSAATRLSKYFSRFLTCDAFYNTYKLQNKTSGGIDLDTERGGLDVTSHPLKNSTLSCSYQWEDTNRGNAEWSSTRKNIYRISWSQRILKKLRLNTYYKKTRIDDPFVMKDQTFNGLVQTSLPQKEDEMYGSVNWSPLYNLTLSTSLRYTDSRSSRYDSDEDLWEYVISLWYVPTERLTLTGSYTLSKTTVDSFGTLKTYHLTDPKSLFTYDNFPYDGRSRACYFSATYLLTHRITISGDVTWIDSTADFDKKIAGRNLGSYSDLSIGQLDSSLGIAYACTNRLTLNARFVYREYNDHETDYYDGKINMVSIGANWSF
jgi:hypothetical protein